MTLTASVSASPASFKVRANLDRPSLEHSEGYLRRPVRQTPAVADVPITRYARARGDLSIAYQVSGTGSSDLVLVPGIVSHVEAFYELPGYRRFIDRLGTFARVVAFDKPGNGLSDRVSGVRTLEERADDFLAVLDELGIERVTVMGWSEGGALSVLLAAAHPDRV